MNLDLYQNYTITVNMSSPLSFTESAFSLQIHTQLYYVLLSNNSEYCQTHDNAECTASGSNVGLIQLWNRDLTKFSFRVRVECGQGKCLANSTVDVLMVVVELTADG